MDEKHALMECPATNNVWQRFCCVLDLAVPPCMRQLAWGGDMMMLAKFTLTCLGQAGFFGSSAH